MCGIGGAVGRSGEVALARFSSACLAANAHRGPDHEAECPYQVGSWEVRLAHSRLAILDLSPSGNQPKAGQDGAVHVTYNGEIYNYIEIRAELEALGHRFHSTSDTEVLLVAYSVWGLKAFERCNGMFALALLDQRARRLHLVRDRFGVKPLFYHLAETRLLFASTPGVIASVVGRTPDFTYLGRGARFGLFDDASARSQYAEVRAVRPGSIVTIRLDDGALRSEEQDFYRLSERVSAGVDALTGLERTAAVAECRARLDDAIALRLRADVTVALSLSGGVDSATIAALAAVRHPGIVGFTYGHPDRPETEGPAVARTVAQTGIGVQYVMPTTADMIRMFWECLEAQDAPFTTGAIVAQYAVFRAVRAAGVKVLLGGQGGDEVFMGYRKYLAWRWLADVRRAAPAALGSGWDLARALWAERGQGRTYLRAARRFGKRGSRDSVLQLPVPAGAPYSPAQGLGLRGRQVADMTTGGLPTLLRYEDRSSMDHSVESRLPFLDYRLAEWAIAAPVRTKLAFGYGKWMLRQVGQGMVPAEILSARSKRGFDVRIGDWIAEGLGGQIRAELGPNWKLLAEYLPAGARCDELFSDRALAEAPARFADAVTCLWVGRRLTG